jgi:membrane fusion protein, multidrug efflux system
MSLTRLTSFFSAALILIVSACGNKNQQAGAPQGPPPVNVVTVPVTVANASYYDEYPATIKALNETELRAQVNGYITAIHFTEGSKVRKGDRLYSIDQQAVEATYQQAQANLAVVEANFVKAQKDVERYRELAKSDAISRQQVDNAEAAYTAAQKQVEASRATVKSVQTNVRYSTIVAPFDGTIGLSNVRLGAAVSAGQTLLNTISSDDPIAVDITVDQREIFAFTQLQAKKPAKDDSTFRLAFGGQQYALPGKISVIDRAVDQNTGSIKMRLTFPNPDHILRSGMSGQLRVLTASADKSILIPYKAITEQLGEFFVYVTVPDNKVTQRNVLLGKQIGKNVIILDGLKEGETIVTEGVQNLREGSVINANPPAAPAPGATPAK